MYNTFYKEEEEGGGIQILYLYLQQIMADSGIELILCDF